MMPRGGRIRAQRRFRRGEATRNGDYRRASSVRLAEFWRLVGEALKTVALVGLIALGALGLYLTFWD